MLNALHTETTPDLSTVLVHNALLDKEIEVLLKELREARRELALFKGLDPDQAEIDLLKSIQHIQLRSGTEHAAELAKMAEEVLPPVEASEAKPLKRGHGPTPQPGLYELEQTVGFKEPPQCMQCQRLMDLWPGKTEDSEMISMELRRIVKVNLHRQKYRCRCNSAITTAPAPKKPIPGGRYTTEFAVDVVVSKYIDHLPLGRQEKRFERDGLVVTRQTLWDQVSAVATLLEPTAEALRQKIFDSPFLHADETGCRLTAKGSKGPDKKTLWVLSTPQHAWYCIRGKSFEDGEAVLSGYDGIVVTDGYQVYQQLARAGPLRLAHCWSHVLRKFRDTLKHRRIESEQILKLIGDLYKIENEIERTGSESVDLVRIARAREMKTKPVLQAIKSWALSQTGAPRSDFMKAVRYLLRFWDGLVVFADEPMIPPDNNAAERALRGPVLGRKNYQQFRSVRGCEVAAVLYSLCESAKLQGVSPERYLTYAVNRALDEPGAVTLPEDLPSS